MTTGVFEPQIFFEHNTIEDERDLDGEVENYLDNNDEKNSNDDGDHCKF